MIRPRFLRLSIAAAITAGLGLAVTPSAQTSAPRSAPGRLVKLNDITLHYEERGSGEPLLLLHGFGMCG